MDSVCHASCRPEWSLRHQRAHVHIGDARLPAVSLEPPPPWLPAPQLLWLPSLTLSHSTPASLQQVRGHLLL